jgi:hypothetical protein
MYALQNGRQDSVVALVLIADIIVKMRQDMGLTKKDSIKPIDILRIFVTDIETGYEENAAAAKKFKKDLFEKRYPIV